MGKRLKNNSAWLDIAVFVVIVIVLFVMLCLNKCYAQDIIPMEMEKFSYISNEYPHTVNYIYCRGHNSPRWAYMGYGWQEG